MASGSDWYPSRRAAQRAMYGNVAAKIVGYVDVIDGLTADAARRIQLICETYIAIYDGVEHAEATTRGLHEWQQKMENGTLGGTIQKTPPVFLPVTLPPGAFEGFVKEFRDSIGLLKKQPGYTRAIGEDLKIVALRGEELDALTIKPELVFTAQTNYGVRVTGKMQSMSAVKIYYRRRATGEWVYIGFLTQLPGVVNVSPAAGGEAETGDVRGIYTRSNAETGQFSNSQEITLT